MKSLDQHFRRITRPIFEHYGFAHGELIAQWADIVGSDVADLCIPERLKWPKGRSGSHKHTEGAMLCLKANPGTGLVVEQQQDRIMDRINAFYGYQAVTSLKISQAHKVVTKKTDKPGQQEVSQDIKTLAENKTQAVSDSQLRSALERLGQAAISKAETIG